MTLRGNRMNRFGTGFSRKQKFLIGVSALVLASSGEAFAQAANTTPVEQVTVSGSRVVTDALEAPTPITIVSTDQLAATTPTDIPDALNKLPIFQGSQNIGQPGGGGTNAASNVLEPAQFRLQPHLYCSNRTLVMMDGHRVTPSNADGTVDADTLPQMLISRVDIVTGGASAVYGSDAVTGVVNFILDKKFDGFKFDVNGGISSYADAATYKTEAAFGTDLFGGRGHFEGSVEYRHGDGINVNDRPLGPLDAVAVRRRHRRQPFHPCSEWPPAEFHRGRPGPELRAGMPGSEHDAVHCQWRARTVQSGSGHRHLKPEFGW